VPANHYEVLGVAATAPAAELRQAYLARARRLHPDRWVDASPGERERVQRSMQEVNEAWRVLGDPARRRAYDAERVGAPRPADPDAGTGGPGAARFTASQYQAAWDADFSDEVVVHDHPAARFLRAMPWLLVAAALFAIFVFTAYAGGPSSSTPGKPAPTHCARVQPGGEAAVAALCGPDTRKVLSEVSGHQPCPAGDLVARADANTAYCLGPPQ
jgi:DnaJ domain